MADIGSQHARRRKHHHILALEGVQSSRRHVSDALSARMQQSYEVASAGRQRGCTIGMPPCV